MKLKLIGGHDTNFRLTNGIIKEYNIQITE